jgi:L-seryl-tRNA(Ser) seleniumtransferase
MTSSFLPGPGETSNTPTSAPQALRLPSVDRLLLSEDLAPLSASIGRPLVKRAIQQTLAELRESKSAAEETQIIRSVIDRAQASVQPQLRSVINLTGTVIHTNLGRAVLSEEVIASVADAMRSYNALEFDLEHGERGDRDTVVEALICRLTGAQAATVVNNCAAAVLLSLVALGARREVIISRSEQIEIGGSFRMPDIMKAANCRLVEVGTTNRTHLRDYQEAIKEKTALIVKAHRSNYAVTGFTAEVGDEE